MTMFSKGGLQFGILTIISSFGNVWADQSYWQVHESCGWFNVLHHFPKTFLLCTHIIV